MAKIAKLKKIPAPYAQIGVEACRHNWGMTSPGDILMYLHSHADNWQVSAAQIAKAKGVSRNTVNNHLRRLEETGFLWREKHPSGRSTYHVAHAPNAFEPIDQILVTGSDGVSRTLGTECPTSGTSECPTSGTHKKTRRQQENKPLPPAAPTDKKKALSAEQKQQRDSIFRALCIVDGSTYEEIPKSAMSGYGKSMTELWDVGVTSGAEVESRALTYRQRHRDWPLTSRALVKHWAALGSGGFVAQSNHQRQADEYNSNTRARRRDERSQAAAKAESNRLDALKPVEIQLHRDGSETQFFADGTKQLVTREGNILEERR